MTGLAAVGPGGPRRLARAILELAVRLSAGRRRHEVVAPGEVGAPWPR